MPRNRLLLPKLFLVLPVLWLFVVFYVATVIQFNNDLSPEETSKYKQGYKNNAFNQFASDMISIHRTLPEVPDEECRSEKYSDDLPNTSVIVCFHNEAWSVLLRTVHSILERTPENLLKEIVLVDDFSELKHLKEPLARYMSQFPKVKIVRLEKREGLIRARLRGAAVADGQVLTYLDSHCECTEGRFTKFLAAPISRISVIDCIAVFLLSVPGPLWIGKNQKMISISDHIEPSLPRNLS
ncbi:unnamed protein product [Nippostrongylus brasiliensis]|uniref:Glyco_trans_2-like domain-containing protein n=1 Tax=Nippostrongylus brasiliensis TaxID=27835 RepID=A0A0N4YMB4_NIPBR|nr:unnamed protein product [Nippostrongylus brasiliensis]